MANFRGRLARKRPACAELGSFANPTVAKAENAAGFQDVKKKGG